MMTRKIFDGTKIRDMTPQEEADFNASIQANRAEVPETLTRTQFFKQVWKMGRITAQQAKDAIAKRALPPQFTQYLDAIADPTERDDAEMDLLGLDVFRRSSSRVESIRAANNWTSAQVDAIWVGGNKL